MYKDKINQAWHILEKLKTRIINILWNDSKSEYNNEHLLIPWLREEAEYAIKALKLPEKDEQYFMIKIDQIIGEYKEE
ncbi:MAG: hypothetical protein ACLFM7_06080 [Bacteroidales bacterium]